MSSSSRALSSASVPEIAVHVLPMIRVLTIARRDFAPNRHRTFPREFDPVFASEGRHNGCFVMVEDEFVPPSDSEEAEELRAEEDGYWGEAATTMRVRGSRIFKHASFA